MSDSSGRVWYFYLDDMITCAEKVLAYCAGLWSIVRDEVPALLAQLQALRNRHD